MSPVVGEIPEIVSPLTLALLQDSGWYRPNFKASQISNFGHGMGCDFVNKECILKNDDGWNGGGDDTSSSIIPEYSKGSFCNIRNKLGCDPTFRYTAMCDLVNYGGGNFKKENGPKLSFQHFENPYLGALSSTSDFCPTYSQNPISCETIISHPPRGGDREKQENTLSLSSTTIDNNHVDGVNTRCFPTTSTRPICLLSECDKNEGVVKVTIDDIEYKCLEGKTIPIPGTDYEIECPKFSLICPNSSCPANCSGRGLCIWVDSILSLSSTGEKKIEQQPKQQQSYCQCFDENDKSDGCYDSFKSIPSVWSALSSSSTTTTRLNVFYNKFWRLCLIFFIL